MTSLRLGRSAYGVLAAITVLSGCGYSQLGPVRPGESDTTSARSVRSDALSRNTNPDARSARIGTLEFYPALPGAAFFGANVALGPDGNLWYSSEAHGSTNGNSTISKFSTSGETTYTVLPTCSASCGFSWVFNVVNGPDGRIWFGTHNGVIGAMDTNGNVQYYNGPIDCDPRRNPCGIALGAIIGQNIWFWLEPNTSNESDYVGYIDTSTGLTTAFSTGRKRTGPSSQIVLGPDGNLWFGVGEDVGRVTQSGAVSLFATKPAINDVETIVAGPDGDLWFSGPNAGEAIGRMTTAGKMHGETVVGDGIAQLVLGPDNHVWGTDDFIIFRMNSAKRYSELKIPRKYDRCLPQAFAIGADGNLWFESYDGSGKPCKYGIGTVIPTN